VKENEDNFEVYDDNNLSHVIAGPDYGQLGNTELKWTLKAPKPQNNNLTINAINSKNILINVLKV
jgi:hypothetical protein